MEDTDSQEALPEIYSNGSAGKTSSLTEGAPLQ